MKRRVILISALIMIGIVGGIALSQILSNTVDFTVKVNGPAALNIDKVALPTEPLYQGVWYSDAIELNVTNLDVNQGYLFYLVVTVQKSGIIPDDFAMTVKQSSDDGVTYSSPTDISSTFQQEASNLINGTYLKVAKIPIDAYGGPTDSIFLLISFKIASGAPTGDYTFYFEAFV